MPDHGHVRTFNRIADRYDEKFGRDCETAHTVVLQWARQAGICPERVLDIGCGTGVLLEAAAAEWPGTALLGIDPANRMLAIARRRLAGSEHDLRVAQVEDLPHSDATVDLVLSTTSFGHWTDQAAGLREVARVLRPGGLCVIAEHAPPGWLMATTLKIMGRLPRLADRQQLQQMVQRAGLLAERAEVVPGTFVVTQSRKPAQERL
ncbi:ubiquinone/menaquinone biosynthesis C-methylase UbiE [Kibdelosporangium banguiense]|uniref:Ubiquinone/menaquinone biosynthesis C-methylase UbiE n=1 Tax=Kibdelosporangium banguiense TaxID=1365924 RepID=A0ABS4TYA5_9PSEU|nr:class I SAM-dependent methyltransferase [Kibdelosporangium banguiense]MBP2329388.1 ubiquinone/menaquinone biosynthesis C-methylase UbiE [Kibdelosporangium banguiense]